MLRHRELGHLQAAAPQGVQAGYLCHKPFILCAAANDHEHLRLELMHPGFRALRNDLENQWEDISRMIQRFRAQAMEPDKQSPIPNSATVWPCDFTSLSLSFVICRIVILIVIYCWPFVQKFMSVYHQMHFLPLPFYLVWALNPGISFLATFHSPLVPNSWWYARLCSLPDFFSKRSPDSGHIRAVRDLVEKN